MRKHHKLKMVLCCFVFLCQVNSYGQNATQTAADRLFEDGEKLFNANPPSMEGYQQAIFNYRSALDIYQTLGGHALQSANCHLRMGALYQTFEQWQEALNAYRQSIAIKLSIAGLSDSLLLDEYVYSGNIHYVTENFDSAAVARLMLASRLI